MGAERQSWTERPSQWKYFLFTALLAALQVYLGMSRGDRWFAALAAIFAALCFTMSALAYRAVHTR